VCLIKKTSFRERKGSGKHLIVFVKRSVTLHKRKMETIPSKEVA
jgi:hypothetical protein